MEETDMYNKTIMNDLAIKLAKYHTLKPPMDKKTFWIRRSLTEDLEEFNDRKIVGQRELFAAHEFKALLETDIKTEFEWVAHRLDSFESPIVFGHNDFRIGNILLTEDSGLLLSDFDHSFFGYRALDFASMFANFYTTDEQRLGFKDETVVTEFIASYVKQCQQICGKEYSDNKHNSVEHIIKETKLFLMVYQLFIAKVLIGERCLPSMDDKQTLVI